jgi:hypothetical protein
MQRQLGKHLLTVRRKLYEDGTTIFRTARARDQSFLPQPINQLDRAVVLDLQALGKICDARLFPWGLALNGQHNLVVLRLDANVAGCGLAGTKKTPDLVPELRQRLVVGESNAMIAHKQVNTIISYCDI